MSITFYPTVSRAEFTRHCTTSRVLLVASSFAAEEVRKYGLVRGSIPVPTFPESVTDAAADCGGFVATFKWGNYRYSPEQYTDWLYAWKIRPTWAAMMDFCCEDEITSGNQGIVRERQDKTTAMAHYFWNKWQAAPWCWVPTIQGWTIEDYQRHAWEIKPLIEEMQAHYGPDSAFRVGIGTLCHRASVEMIHEVVRAVSAILTDVPLHLWGIKLGSLQSPVAMPESVVSMDSAAWNGMWGRGRAEWKSSGLPQRQYCLQVALPTYQAKLETALAGAKQLTLEVAV